VNYPGTGFKLFTGNEEVNRPGYANAPAVGMMLYVSPEVFNIYDLKIAIETNTSIEIRST